MNVSFKVVDQRLAVTVCALTVSLASEAAAQRPVHAARVFTHSHAQAAQSLFSSSQDNTTYHNGNYRLGWYANETALTAATVASSAFHQVGSIPIAGKSFSQPLYLSAQALADNTLHNVLIVTDSTDVVYAYDADSLTRLWMRDFKGQGIRQQLSADISCDATWPDDGINGTPVIDRDRNLLYVVVPTNQSGVPHLRLHALSLFDGTDAVSSVDIAATGALAPSGTATVDPAYNYNRAGLLEADGTVYVALSTHCDYHSGSVHGWLVAYNADTLAQTAALDTTANNVGNTAGVRYLGSIWQSGFGIAADDGDNVFFATGNGPNDGAVADDAMSILKLPPNLDSTQKDSFTPASWLADSKADYDLGSGGVMLLPDQASGAFVHLAIAGGKTGKKFLLNRDNLGGLHKPDQVLFEANTDYGIWGGPAYFVDPLGNQKIVYGGTPTLGVFTLTTSPTYGLTRTSSSNVGWLDNRDAGVSPVVSSNGTLAGSAVVWAIKSKAATDATAPVTLYAFDGANLAHTLFSAPAGQWTENADTGNVLVTPLVANGRVYLATDGQVTVFGLQ